MKKQQKIFIVEDNLFYANLLKIELFKKDIVDVEIFPTGELCIQNLKKNPDIVILDHNLGNKHGSGVLKNIKTLKPNVQVIYHSSQKKIHVALLSIKYGAFAYVEKNTSAFRRISALINRILKYNQNQKEVRQFKVIKFTILLILSVSITLIFKSNFPS